MILWSQIARICMVAPPKDLKSMLFLRAALHSIVFIRIVSISFTIFHLILSKGSRV